MLKSAENFITTKRFCSRTHKTRVPNIHLVSLSKVQVKGNKENFVCSHSSNLLKTRKEESSNDASVFPFLSAAAAAICSPGGSQHRVDALCKRLLRRRIKNRRWAVRYGETSLTGGSQYRVDALCKRQLRRRIKNRRWAVRHGETSLTGRSRQLIWRMLVFGTGEESASV
eukprot:g18697.t1